MLASLALMLSLSKYAGERRHRSKQAPNLAGP